MRITFWLVCLILAWYFKISHIASVFILVAFISSLKLADLDKNRKDLLEIDYNSYDFPENKLYEKKLKDSYYLWFIEWKIDLIKYIEFACIIWIWFTFFHF